MSSETEYPEIDGGGRFRWIGTGGLRIKEYMPTLLTACGLVSPIGVTVEVQKPEVKPPRKNCPFKGGMNPRCTDDCSFCTGEVCKLGEAQQGKRCAININLICGTNCTMYNNSGRCTLFFAAERT